MSDDEAATAGMWAVSGNKKTDSLTSIIKSISYFFIKSFYTDEGGGNTGIANLCRHFVATWHRRQRIELQGGFEVLRRKVVSIAHSHLNIMMAEDALQHQNVTARHHKVRRKGMANIWGSWPLGK